MLTRSALYSGLDKISYIWSSGEPSESFFIISLAFWIPLAPNFKPPSTRVLLIHSSLVGNLFSQAEPIKENALTSAPKAAVLEPVTCLVYLPAVSAAANVIPSSPPAFNPWFKKWVNHSLNPSTSQSSKDYI